MSSNTKPYTAGGEHPLPPIGIAIMGTTGAGKTSFINVASGSHLRVGNDLMSCTAEVELSKEFIVDGRRVIIMDTPGFDDTNTSDSDILKKIAAYLDTTYQKGYKLAGILYVHRICDVRFTGASTRNLRMFKKLCGEEAMKNVIFVTNMWGTLEKHVEERHEQQLIDTHFKPALDKGAHTARHSNTRESAHEIIRRIIKNVPTPLLIQEELAKNGGDIEKTSAGETVNEELNKVLARHKAEIEELREEMLNAAAKEAKEMRAETDALKKLMEQMEAERAATAAKYEAERETVEKKMEDMIRKMKEQDLEERRKAQEEHERQLDELNAKVNRAPAEEKNGLVQIIRGVERLCTDADDNKDECIVM